MRHVTIAALSVVLLTATGTSLFAQQRAIMPQLQMHSVNPGVSLSDPATTPLQQQMQDDYATSLMATQRQLLQQNPSGVSRPEIGIGHELNSFTAPR
jgi:hypothetical protein